ncbi:hypothetical protein AMTR_s00069p00173060 [Amborella trichopoda]|uniref:BAT2 N-terminal domain-containing protein n=1 Tax=Amborella trichopoda TaxID=13333 RepID=U5DDC0_AMBTC|nr:hypothetical protein AMTR_s00069p00173060 [Amborella trichopoda]
MSSSVLAGDRRWTSTRRGGMQLLGKIAVPKVAVPKPVNLPSQRLENHGLDPNVEIVPKGTLGWGSNTRPTAPGNAWGLSALSSPNTDGSPSSINRLTGRPSSGGDTRPSTAGSDKSQEPVSSSAWGPSSRPSSASGVLGSNQTLLPSPRPHSAETRPGSSQLSRFAEPLTDSSVAWRGSGTAEKLGVSSSKGSGFMLSSGDFPTLGSDKPTDSNARQGHSSHGRPSSASGHPSAPSGRPSSASGRPSSASERPSSASGRQMTPKERPGTSPSEDVFVDDSTEKGSVNTWKRENSPYSSGGAAPPYRENWQRDQPQQMQPYANMAMPPPPHFDPWQGAPVRNPQEGPWFRGPPHVGPYGPSGPTGPYPVDPSAYFHGPMPVRPLPYTQPVPRPSSGGGGYHQNGESFRPLVPPDPYMVPSRPMPLGQGVYPSPVPYDGYYGPPRVGFNNSDDRDPTMMGPSVYNRYPNQNTHPDSSRFQGKPAQGANSGPPREVLEARHGPEVHQGPYKVLLKPNYDWSDKNSGQKEGNHLASNATMHSDKVSPRTSGENDWGAAASNDEPMDFSKPAFSEEVSSQNSPDNCRSSVVSDTTSEATSKPMVSVDRKFDTTDSKPKLPQEPLATRTNVAGARSFEGRYQASQVVSKEEKPKRFKVVNGKSELPAKEHGSAPVSTEKAPGSDVLVLISHKDEGATIDDHSESSGNVTVETKQPEVLHTSMEAVVECSEIGERSHSHSNQRGQVVQGRGGYRAKGRFNNNKNFQESEEWRRKASGESSQVNVLMPDYHAGQDDFEKHVLDISIKVGGVPYLTSSFDSDDHKAQRAKMKEIATQRAKQLQKEEEERTREQKAKALAKLEELNRRTVAEGSVDQKIDQPLQQGNNSQTKPVGTTESSSKTIIGGSQEALCSEAPQLPSNEQETQMTENSSTKKPEDSTSFTSSMPSKTPSPSWQVTSKSPLPPPQEASTQEAPPIGRPAPQGQEISGGSKQRPSGYKRKPTLSHEKNLNNQPAPVSSSVSKPHGITVVDSTCPSGSPEIIAHTEEASITVGKKKFGRNLRNKHKPDETEVNIPANANQLQPFKEAQEALISQNAPSLDQGPSQPSEEAPGKVNQWKPQPSRRPTRGGHTARVTEKFHGSEAVVWAPVKAPSQPVPSDEPAHNCKEEAPTVKAEQVSPQSPFKSKRAEIERYVPKPVAKEQAQQGKNCQQESASAVSQAFPDQTSGKQEMSQTDNEISIDSGGVKNIEGKQHRHAKGHGSWRQRNSHDSSHDVLLNSLEWSSSGDQNKMADRNQPPKQETFSPKRQAKHYDNSNNGLIGPVSSKGQESPFYQGESLVVTVEKGKRSSMKVQRGGSHNQSGIDKEWQAAGAKRGDYTQTGIDKDWEAAGAKRGDNNQSLTVETIELEGKGGVVLDQTTSQWQPKSQAYSAHQRQGGGRNGDRGGPGGQKSSVQVVRASLEKELNPQFNSQKTLSFSKEAAKPGHQDLEKSEKVLHNQQATSVGTPIDSQTEQQQQQPVYRRHPLQSNRFMRGPGHELPYGGRAHGLESGKQHVPSNGERRKHNSHYEYQPVGSNKPSEATYQKSLDWGEYDQVDSQVGLGPGYQQRSGWEEENQVGSKVGPGPRYRDRGQGQGRRGGRFYARNNLAASSKVTAGHGNGE